MGRRDYTTARSHPIQNTEQRCTSPEYLPQKYLPGYISDQSQISTTCFQLNEWCKTIISEVKTLILHPFIEPKASGRYLRPVDI